MKKEKKYGLIKAIVIFLVIAIVLSWLIPAGDFNSGSFADGGMVRVGIGDLGVLVFSAVYMCFDKILFLLTLGGFYGVLSKTKAYSNLVDKIAKRLSKHKKATVVILSIVIAALTSILTETFAVLIFIPFIVSILNRMKLDKMTVFATTFGSMLVGILGATFGTDGLASLNTELSVSNLLGRDLIFNTILVRSGILVVALLLFNFLVISHMSKVQSNNEETLMFEEETAQDKKANLIPLIVFGLILLIITILGFIDWQGTFNINVFEEFHDFINDVKIGNFAIFSSILGSQMKSLGTWDLFCISPIIFAVTLLIGLCYRVKVNDLIANFMNGVKKMIIPAFVVTFSLTLLNIVYMSSYVATIGNKLYSLTDGFNLATMTLTSFISSMFHSDLGFSGYIFGPLYAAQYVDFINPIYIIMLTSYGLVQFFIPTGIIMGVGLTSLNVKYKDWLKFIWKFIVGMLICLLVIFILITLL